VTNKSIVFVSRNQGKNREANYILEKFDLSVQVAELDKIEIQADNVAEIASQSARELIPSMTKPFIVEDAGLHIHFLKGFPGPYSHYALETIGCEGILKLLGPRDSRDAYFESAVAYADPTGTVKTFVGRVEGSLSIEVRGGQGFGYDPIFIPSGWTKTLGEVSISEKSEISHRRRSMESFANWFLALNLTSPQS
jgi:XTP/dITP diphosphohydrolase